MSLKLPRNWDFNLKMDAAKIARSRSVMSGDPAGARPGSPSALERPLKLGWLKKQRSIVKNWQHRYFVLKGQQLYYYKDEDDAKPQGCLSLQGSTIKVVATNPEEGGKFIFEIIPGVAGEQSRAGQDSCVLMASSHAEMEEWVKSIRRALGSASGAVFGQHLAETMAYEQKFGQHQVPILVQKSAEFIREHGVSEEGIFRLPGQDNLVRQLRDAFDAGERPSFDRDTDVHTVASLFKLYLRELPEPVVPWLQYEDFLLCGKALEADETKGHQELVKQLSLLPRDNYNLLSYICRFLYEIQLNSSVNKMSVDNLATVIGVNLIRPKIEDPAIIMRGTPQVQKVMTVMISDHEKLFPPSKDVPPSPPAQKTEKKAPVPRSSVGWGAAEGPTAPRGSIQRQMRDHPNSSSTPGPAASSSVPGEDTESKDTQGMWKTQPRKRTQTLPTRKSFLAAAPPGEKGCKEKNDVFASDFWKSSTRPVGSDGHKRTLSHDLFKLLDLHRASTYDNVPPSQAESGEGSGSSPSPASSISEKEFLPCFSPSHEPKEPASPTSSPAEDSKPEQESREFLQSMILKLEKDLEAQRNEYEGQIKSLQNENYEVWAKVVRLNQDIEQEKKKSGELELKLRNAERSREDLEKKTKVLEEEIKNLTKSTSKTGAKTN
ncbi:rho GTPase-activating protein 25 [Corvus hawaiiensis]|uniref:rho GTPase-activating protein 25 n=1 Tax=Corvus kubaryi TaxID=68294 RepID=UPI001C054CD6|nr:rho GTPase-activating protein 25 [Corvus kubaryi]XP_048146155.1 rho GTPase-activating protein 25 [Corvus hawaiiensis]